MSHDIVIFSLTNRKITLIMLIKYHIVLEKYLNGGCGGRSVSDLW
jgi:hypothetical protein